ncbi:MAG: SdpI family protein [Candidatus Micrarchaeota archaeon]
MNKCNSALTVLALFSIVLAAWGYSVLPPVVASHWNAAGLADGFSSKETSFLFPVLVVVIIILFNWLPKYDPLAHNIEKFGAEWSLFKAVLVAFFIYVQALFIAYNLGFTFNFGQLLAPGLAALFYAVGVMLAKAKRNYFIGIRTPWTLASDLVWDKTHSIGAKLFKAVAVAVLVIGILLPQQAIWVLLGLLGGVVAYLLYFSYREWKKEGRKRKPRA